AVSFLAVPVVQAQGKPDTPVNPFAADPASAIASGKRVFDATCSACHGGNGVGTERAPSLDSGRFKHGGEDFDLFQTIEKGVQGTQMPPFGALGTDRIWELVSYVHSLSQAPAAGPAAPTLGSPGRGEQLFFGAGQCSSCHEIDGRGLPIAA